MRVALAAGLLAAAVLAAGCADATRARIGHPLVAEAAVGYGGSIHTGTFDKRGSSEGGGGSLFGGGAAGGAAFAAEAPSGPPGVGDGPALDAGSEGEAGSVGAVDPRKVIYSGSFNVVVADVEKALADTRKMAEAMGGYMQQMTGEGIVVRIPAEKFDQAVEALGKMGTITEREITARDVTEEYEDLALRLDNARKLAVKLQELLGQAKTVKEALDVEKELARVRTEIESLEGRLNRLKNQVAYATLAATFIRTEEAPEETRTELPFVWLSEMGLDFLFGYEKTFF